MNRTTYATIMFGLEDVSATEDGVFESTDSQPFSIFKQLVNDSNKLTPVQTNEPNMAILDGTTAILNYEASQQIGYWSKSMSDENGEFAVNPRLSRTFDKYHSTPSIIFYFYGYNRPKKIRVKYYRDNQVITDATFDVTSSTFLARKSAKDYNKFEIEFIGTYAPYSYIKLAEIFYGEYLIWDRENIIEAKTVEEFNLISDELPIGELEFSIFDEDDDFNILNPAGMYTSLQQKQKILVTETINNVEYEYGTYYLDTWENAQGKIANFVAKDCLSLIDDVTFTNSSMYQNVTVSRIIGDIMEQANFGNYEIQPSLASETLSGYIPICTCREALQYVCIASNSCAFCDRTGTLQIRKMPLLTDIVDMTKTRKWDTKVTQNDVVNYVSVTGYSFDISSEVSELYKETLKAGNYEVQLTEPALNFTISDNAVINSSNVNFVNFTVNTEGETIINGNKYIPNSNVVVVEGDNVTRRKQVELKDVYLIDFERASTVCHKIYDYYQRRLIETFTFINNMERLGENVKIELELEQIRNGTITKMETDLTGGFLTEATVVNEV